MAKKKVCVSFDFDHDKQYYYLLKAWNGNDDIDFSIDDCTPSEIQSQSVATIKQVLSRKINEANYMIVIVGAHSTDKHSDSKEIGYNNWQSYEIAKNNEFDNELLVVKLDTSCDVPIEAYGVGAKWVNSFNEEDILNALDELANGK